MGTLEKQPPRNYHGIENKDVINIIDQAIINADEYNVSVADALKALEIAAYERRTTAIISNGDIWDEQIAGIGKLIDNVGKELARIATAQEVE